MAAAHALSPAESAVPDPAGDARVGGGGGVLVAIKAAAWAASGSVALLASLADSGLDLVASLITFFAVRYAAAPPDAEHRFGTARRKPSRAWCRAGWCSPRRR